VSVTNFRYTGARVCGYLSNRLQPNYGICFQDCLIVRLLNICYLLWKCLRSHAFICSRLQNDAM